MGLNFVYKSERQFNLMSRWSEKKKKKMEKRIGCYGSVRAGFINRCFGGIIEVSFQ